MKAAVFEAPGKITVKNVPVPEVGPGEVLIEVAACGICGTDLRIQDGEFDADYPVIAGHEFSGKVVEVGSEVSHVKPGDWVAVNPNSYCRRCDYCYRGQVHLCDDMTGCGVAYDGGFAECCKVAAQLALPVSEALPLEQWAMMEPVSCCLHGIDAAQIEPGARVVVLGGGSIGLILTQLARHAGASQVIVSEPKEGKRALAERLGADATVDPLALGDGLAEAVLDLTAGGADVAIEAAGLPATAGDAVRLVRKGGTVLFFGVCPMDCEVPIRPFDIYHYEITIKGSFTNPLTDSRAIRLLGSGRVTVEPLITHRFPLEEVEAGLAAVREGETVKALVSP
ncbi:MAG: zinc-dependent alcohol dehydrogenase family protein [Armatimonadota bacterium]